MDSSQGDLIKNHSATVLIQENDEDVESRIEGESNRTSRCSSIAWSESVATTLKGYNKGDQFRGLKRRSSVENFGQFGFLVPALALCPHADGVSIDNVSIAAGIEVYEKFVLKYGFF